MSLSPTLDFASGSLLRPGLSLVVWLINFDKIGCIGIPTESGNKRREGKEIRQRNPCILLSIPLSVALKPAKHSLKFALIPLQYSLLIPMTDK